MESDTWAPKCWLFQAHPKGDDLRRFLAGAKVGQKFSWKIPPYKSPKEHMRAGDHIVLWQSPGGEREASGVYGLGTLTGRFRRAGREAEFTLEALRQLNAPIPRQLLVQNQDLRTLPVLRPKGQQGPCFNLKPSQWTAIVKLWGIAGKRTNKKSNVRVTSLPVQVPHVEHADVEREAISYESERREAHLVKEYVNHIERKGHRVDRKIFTTISGEEIECDIFDLSRRNLIEAKGSTDRRSIRMAVGQLADYRRFLKPAPALAILVPSRPNDDLVALLHSQRISVIWRSNGGAFKDNGHQRFT